MCNGLKRANIMNMEMIFGLPHYSSPPLIGTALLPSNAVLIREVSFGERKDHMHCWSFAAKNLCPY